MKFILLLFITSHLTFLKVASAQTHDHHSKHRMILLGESEIFASHIVYKMPHNIQLILKLLFPIETRQAYLQEKVKFPGDLFILVLDPMDLSKIAEAKLISGTIYREIADGTRSKIADTVIEGANFKIIYYEELPTDLAGVTDPVILN